MEKNLENLREEILAELPPASQLVDSLLKKSNEVLRNFMEAMKLIRMDFPFS